MLAHMTKAKIPLIILTLITLATQSHAGIIGWFTSKGRDWQFVQQTGGMRIGDPIDRYGKKVLPVEYDVSGLTTVTCKPTTMNSGLAVRKIKAKKKDKQIVLRVFTQLVEKSSINGSHHFVDLTGIPAGSYEVYYETAGAKEKLLGQIEIK
jgi:hypothetical protein